MPHATPELRRLRIEALVMTGPFAELVDYNRNAYSNVEHGHRVASPEFFQRCADVLSSLLTARRGISTRVDPDDLIADERKLDREPKRESEHVSPTPLDPARPSDEPTRPPNKPDSASAA